MKKEEIVVSAPGRVCLLGEHQDYFGLSIIAAAINRRISIHGKKRYDGLFKLSLPDIGEEEEFLPKKELVYRKERDYLRSTVNILLREGINFHSGWDCLIKGTIPINSGTASSSALVVAWTKFLLESVQDSRASKVETLAELSFRAEVEEFKEPGGKMDHYTSSLGGILHLNFGDKLKIKQLKTPLKEFVLADSLEKKDTTGMLGYIKNHVSRGVSSIQKKIKNFTLNNSLNQEVLDEIEKLNSEEKRLLKGTFLTRDLTTEAKMVCQAEFFDHQHFGSLLNRQHEILRDYLHISTSKIEKMIETSLKAGALGAKINGSGGGGCIFAYTPHRAEQVAEALKKLGAKAYVVRVDEGVRREK